MQVIGVVQMVNKSQGSFTKVSTNLIFDTLILHLFEIYDYFKNFDLNSTLIRFLTESKQLMMYEFRMTKKLLKCFPLIVDLHYIMQSYMKRFVDPNKNTGCLWKFCLTIMHHRWMKSKLWYRKVCPIKMTIYKSEYIVNCLNSIWKKDSTNKIQPLKGTN